MKIERYLLLTVNNVHYLNVRLYLGHVVLLVGSAPNLGHVEVYFEFVMERAKNILILLEGCSRRARMLIS